MLIDNRPSNGIHSQLVRTLTPRRENPKLSAQDKVGIIEKFARDIPTYERYKQTGDLSCIVSLYKQSKLRRAFDPIAEETVDWSEIGDHPDADQPIEKRIDL